jgi:hypothetical protein
MKVSELTGPALDWAVAKAEGADYFGPAYQFLGKPHLHYSTWWAQGGPILAKERMMSCPIHGVDGWSVSIIRGADAWVAEGPTLLVAAMRCYVASKLGEQVDIPKELTHENV